MIAAVGAVARMVRSWRGVWCALAAFVLVVLGAAVPAGAQEEEADRAEGIVIVGVPGLTWSDLDASETPAMWDLAGSGATASMSVRTIGAWTCPEAAWVSLGAGERAGGASAREAHCLAQSRIPAPEGSGGSWSLPWFAELEEANAAYNYGARLGSLADALAQLSLDQAEAAVQAEQEGATPVAPEPGLCVAAIGVGAGLAAADSEGSIAYWGSDLSSLSAAMETCDVVIVDPGVIVGEPDTAPEGPESTTDYDQLGEDDSAVGAEESASPDADGDGEPEPDPIRVAAASEADQTVAAVVEALPQRWQVMVAGIADAAAPSSLHPVLYAGWGVEAGELTSATTRRDGYVQLVDLAPTALAVVGADVPAAMSGRGVSVLPDAGHSAEAAVAKGVDETAASSAVAGVSWKFYVALSLVGSVAVAAAVWLVTGRDRWRPLARGVCVFVSAVPLAGVVAGIPPWWRADQPELAFWAVIVGVAGAVTALSWLPWLRAGHRTALFVAAATAGLIAVDQFFGATWPLHTPLGYTAQAGARFAGLGNYAFAVFAGAVILLIALIPWRGKALYVGPVVIGVAATVLTGAPNIGGDVGGMLTIVAALVLACLRLWGKRLTWAALIGAGAAAGAVFATVGALDYLRPEADQTHLGRFVAAVLEGSAGQILLRKADAAVSSIGGPLTWLVVAGAIGAWVIWRRRGPIGRTTTDAAVIGLLAAAVIGFAVNDSGVALPAFTIAVGFGLLAVAVGPRPSLDPAAAVATAGTEHPAR